MCLNSRIFPSVSDMKIFRISADFRFFPDPRIFSAFFNIIIIIFFFFFFFLNLYHRHYRNAEHRTVHANFIKG